MGIVSAAYLGLMAVVVLPAYLDASIASIDAVSLGWLLAAGTLVPVGLAVATRQVASLWRTAPAAEAKADFTAQPGSTASPAVQAPAVNLDELTGLRAYAEFADELARQVEVATAGSHPLSLAVLDVDQLAAINSELGEEAGDRLLAGLGRLITTRTRVDDISYRIGADELAILMPHCGAGRAQSVVRRLLLAALEAGDASPDGREWSFSAGVSSYPELSGDAAGLRRDAEAALKWAKRNGRTDVQLFDAFRDLSEEQREEDRARQDAALGGDDYFTTGEQDAPPIQLRFIPAEPAPAPAEWVDPRLVVIGLAEDPSQASSQARSPKRRADRRPESASA